VIYVLTAIYTIFAAPIIIWLTYKLPEWAHLEDAKWAASLIGEATIPPRIISSEGIKWTKLSHIILVSAVFFMSLFAFHVHGFTIRGILTAVFFGALISLALIDIRHRLLPDRLTFPLLWLGLLAQTHPVSSTIGINASLWGAAFGYLLVFIPANIFIMMRQKEGVGQGDAKLMAAIGAWLGAEQVPLILISALLGGLLWQAIMIIFQRAHFNHEFSFGPWLVLATFLIIII
jgi:prepilin signal peptidase PulO-like enzyme (type II secretory pathway)